jgi:hypothetical protein
VHGAPRELDPGGLCRNKDSGASKGETIRGAYLSSE